MQEYKFNFSYSFATKQFTIYFKSNKIIDLKLNLINNNLNLNLLDNSTTNNSSNQFDQTFHLQNSNLNELIFLLIDEIENKHKNLKNLKHFLILSPEFRSSLNSFIYKQRLLYFQLKLNDAYNSLRTDLSLKLDLKQHWLNQINLNQKSANKNEIQNSILLAKMYHHLIHSDYMNLIIKQEYLNTIEYNQKYNQFLLSSNNNEVWSTRIDSLKNKQQRLFSKFIFKLYDEYTNRKPGDKIKEDISDYLDKSDLEDVEDLSRMSLNTVQFLDEKIQVV